MTLNPLPVLKGAWGAIGGFLGGIQTYLIVGAVSASLAAGAAGWASYHWRDGEVNGLKLAAANVQVKIVTRTLVVHDRVATVNLAAATREAYAQGEIAGRAQALQQRIPTYVTPAQDRLIACLPVGFLRVLRAAEDGLDDPGSLALAAGQSDDDCADIAASAVASILAAEITAGRANAEQLNALTASIKAIHDATGSTE